ncbi:MAG TPA: CU044_5270 family protein [Actinomycetota bacterium]
MIDRAVPPAEPSGETVASARAILRRGLPGVRGSRPADRSRRPAMLVAAVVVLSLATAFLLPSLLTSGSSASAALRELGVIAGRQAPVELPQGAFVYTKTVALWQSCTLEGCEPREVTREAWIARDGSGRLVHDDDDWPSERFGPGGLHFENLSALPTDPRALASVIEERVGDHPNGEYEVFVVVGDLLRETYSSPELRRALFEVAASLEGAELVGATTDGLGRPGIGVGYLDDGNLETLVFDERTSKVLGEKTEAPNGDVVSWSSVVASGVVGSVSERP